MDYSSADTAVLDHSLSARAVQNSTEGRQDIHYSAWGELLEERDSFDITS